MADRLVAIRKLLNHELQDRRCAAAIVLAELEVSDKRSVKALIAALDDEDPLVRRYALEALGRIRDESTLDSIMGAFKDPDPQVQSVAEKTLIRFGEQAVPALQQLLKGSSSTKRRAAALLGQLQSTSGIESLVDAVTGSEGPLLDKARQAVRTQAPSLSTAELGSLRKRLEGRLTSARHGKENSLAAALAQLMGDLPDETVVTRLVQEIGIDTPAVVRKAALSAMMNALSISHGRRREAAIEKLLECLAEEDSDGVIRPALRALKGVELPDRFTPRLQELVDAPTAEARAFALGALGKLGSPDSLDMLIEKLISGAAPVRAAARSALLAAPEAAAALTMVVLDVSDKSRLADIGEILHHQAESIPKNKASQLVKQTLDRLEANDEMAPALVDTVARALPKPFLRDLHERVDGRRHAGDLGGAYELLNAIKNCPAFGPEETYQLALIGLLRHDDSSRPPRVTDRVCTPFAQLLKADVNPTLDSRLREEKCLEAKNFFYLGFAFCESHDEDERDFGQELLEEVVERDPDGKHGSRAQNKLRLLQR